MPCPKCKCWLKLLHFEDQGEVVVYKWVCKTCEFEKQTKEEK